MLLRITWATPGSSCEGKSVLGIQALIPGIASSSDESTAPDAPRIMAMTNGRMRNPPRTAYIAERNRTGKRAIIRMPNEFNQYRSICSGRLPRPPLQPSSGLASRADQRLSQTFIIGLPFLDHLRNRGGCFSRRPFWSISAVFPFPNERLHRGLCGLYNVRPRSTWNSNAMGSTFSPSQNFEFTPMRSTSANSIMNRAWRHTRQYIAHTRDWPTHGNRPYSPLFCLSLLLAVGLIIEISRQI